MSTLFYTNIYFATEAVSLSPPKKREQAQKSAQALVFCCKISLCRTNYNKEIIPFYNNILFMAASDILIVAAGFAIISFRVSRLL